MTPDNVCVVCGGRAERVRDRGKFGIGKRRVSVTTEHFRCSQCGEVFYTPEQMDAAQRAASDEVRRQDGLLSPDEIREIRSKYGLTQSAFERLLGVGPKTVVRWERGTVFQNRSTDTLLRILRSVPEAVRFLADAKGVECPAFDVLFATGAGEGHLVFQLSAKAPITHQRVKRAVPSVRRDESGEAFLYKMTRSAEASVALEEIEEAPVYSEKALV
jgi:HTH-type transcriptional regulator/antitoxin MqsA